MLSWQLVGLQKLVQFSSFSSVFNNIFGNIRCTVFSNIILLGRIIQIQAKFQIFLFLNFSFSACVHI